MDEILELYSKIYGVQFIARLDTLLSIEMTIVRPPFIVDFVSAYTDEELERLDFTDVRVFGSTLRTRLESAAELGVF